MTKSFPREWIIWLIAVYSAWLWLLMSGPGFAHYLENWPIFVVMIVGSFVAGFTPEGGGAVAYPILSLFMGAGGQDVRDFGLAIQAIGMTSASIYILSSRRHRWSFYRLVPLYVLLNLIGLIIGFAVFGGVNNLLIQMAFLSLALAFIAAIWSVRRFGHRTSFSLSSPTRVIVVAVMCFLGGIASSMFGTGADMLLYICLSCWFAMREKEATDLSILVMASISVLGILIRWLLMDDVSETVYALWLAAVPAVALGAPLGNWVLKRVSKESMLVFVLIFNAYNFGYWCINNSSLIWLAIPTLSTIYLAMIMVIARRPKPQESLQ